MYTVLHNSRCSKSREALQVMENSTKLFTIREYLKDPLSFEELEGIVEKLGVEPMDIIRTNEAEWKDNFKGKELSKDQLIQSMVDFPKLIQRPIVMDGQKAVVGRPIELVENFINKI